MARIFLYTLFLVLLVCYGHANAQNIITIAGNGAEGYAGDGGPAVAAALNHPLTAKCDTAHNVYIADERNNAVRKINTAGIITTIAGIGTAGYTGRGGQATAAKISKPTDLAFDAKGNLYIAENGNNVISKVTPAGIITTVAGTQVNGYSGDGGPATAAELHGTMGLVFDTLGGLYFSSNGNYRIRKIDTGGIITCVAGTGTSGNTGDNGPATAATLGLTGYISVNRIGEIFIPDYLYHVVRKVDTDGIITTIAGNGSLGTSGDGGPATAAAINSPNAIFFDHKGNMYISDKYDHVIRMVDAAGIITTVAGKTMGGFSGDGGPATAAQFDANINCSDTDATGNLYIADPENNRIRRITYNSVGAYELVANTAHTTVYPNPASNIITITATEQISSLSVINTAGETVFEHSYSNGSNKEAVAITHFANGIYFVLVNNLYAGKLVKE
jgi:hypothetical protein